MEKEFSEKELSAWKREYASGCTDVQFSLWIEMCRRRGLVPVEDVVLQLRSVKEYDEVAKANKWVKRAVFITTIRALLKKAGETGKYQGFTNIDWIYLDADGNPTVSSIVPLPEVNSTDKPRIPWAARVGVKRAGFDEPQYAVCRFLAYAQFYEKEDATGKKTKVLNSTWTTRGPEQLGKCCCAAALRLAFPDETGDLYIAEEFPTEPEPTPKQAPTTPIAEPPAPVVAPAIDHTPAEGKANPRPGELAVFHPAGPATALVVDQAELDKHTAENIEKINNAGKTAEAPATPPAVAAVLVPEPAKSSKKTRTRKAPVKKGEPKPAVPKGEPTGMVCPGAIGHPGPVGHSGSEPITITDADLPPNLQPPTTAAVEPKLEPQVVNDQKPTKAEGAKISEKLRPYAAKVGSEVLRLFILKRTKQDNVSNLTVGQWTDVLKALEGAFDDAELKKLVAGEGGSGAKKENPVS